MASNYTYSLVNSFLLFFVLMVVVYGISWRWGGVGWGI